MAEAILIFPARSVRDRPEGSGPTPEGQTPEAVEFGAGLRPTAGDTKEGISADLLNNLCYQHDICWLHGNVVDVRMTVSTLDMVVNFVGSVGVTLDSVQSDNTR